MFIPISKPSLDGNELKYLSDCVKSTWISSSGEFIEKFEEKVAELAESKYCIATNNGTTALHLALVALGVRPGDEVLIPTLTFIATANAVSYCGAKPILVDVMPNTLEIDLDDARKKLTNRTVGIIPVHLYGIPVKMDKILEFAQEYALFIVEDSAEAHGARFNGKAVGGWGNAGTFSFYGNKIFTTGEGGAITTNDGDLYQRLKQLRGQGMDVKNRYWFPVIGYNYRITNMQAAIGLAQLERSREILGSRDRIYKIYQNEFRNLNSSIEISEIPGDRISSPWLFNIFVKENSKISRDFAMKHLLELEIETRPVFYPMHQLPPYKSSGHWPVADSWSKRGFSIPLFPDMSDREIEIVVDAIYSLFPKN